MRTFRNIQRNARQRPFALASKLRATLPQRRKQFADLADELEDDGIDVQHVASFCPARLRDNGPRSRAQGVSRARPTGASRAARAEPLDTPEHASTLEDP